MDRRTFLQVAVATGLSPAVVAALAPVDVSAAATTQSEPIASDAPAEEIADYTFRVGTESYEVHKLYVSEFSRPIRTTSWFDIEHLYATVSEPIEIVVIVKGWHETADFDAYICEFHHRTYQMEFKASLEAAKQYQVRRALEAFSGGPSWTPVTQWTLRVVAPNEVSITFKQR